MSYGDGDGAVASWCIAQARALPPSTSQAGRSAAARAKKSSSCAPALVFLAAERQGEGGGTLDALPELPGDSVAGGLEAAQHSVHVGVVATGPDHRGPAEARDEVRHRLQRRGPGVPPGSSIPTATFSMILN